MKKILLSILVITALSSIGNTQQTSEEVTKKMAADEKGNIFLVGDYADRKSNKLTNVFVAKYNLDKELI